MTQKHIEDLFEDKARAGDGSFAVAYALLRMAEAQNATAAALRQLGTGDAATTMGAIELLAVEVRDGARAIEAALLAGIPD